MAVITPLYEKAELCDASEVENEERLLQEFWSKINGCENLDIKKHFDFIKDEDLMLLIRARKYNVERAFSTLCDLTELPRRLDIFKSFIPSLHKEGLMRLGIGTFKTLDNRGRVTIYVRASDWDVKEQSVDDILICAVMIGFEALREKITQLNGINILVDCKGFSFTQAKQITPTVIQKHVDLIIHTAPIKIKKVHLINMSSIVGISLNLVKIFLPAKIRKRLIIHRNTSTLGEFYSQDMVPDWIGGHQKESDVKDYELIERLLSSEREDWFRQLVSLYD